MILRTSMNSPFGRKVRVSAAILGIAGDIEIVNANFLDPDDQLRVVNPLGKMPVLVLADGTALFDSPVIVEYLDALAGGARLIPVAGPRRWLALRQQALADGVMDAGALIVMEQNLRPEERRHQPWLDFQREKMQRALSQLAAALAPPVTPDVGSIAIACMLGWIDFRRQVDWRTAHPSLVDWFDAFRAAVPVFDESKPG